MLFDDNNLYIAKVSSTKPESALLLVNTTTKETVPVKTTGNIAYSLTINKEKYSPVQIDIEDKKTEQSFGKKDENTPDSIINRQELSAEQKKASEAKDKITESVKPQNKAKFSAKKKRNPVKTVTSVKPADTEKPVNATVVQKTKLVEQKNVSAAVLKIDGENSEKYLYGLIITDTAGEPKTSVFAYDHESQDFLNLIEKNSEDGNAFVSFIYPRIFTNISSSSIECTNLKTKKQFTLKRSSSLPEKIVSGRDRIAVLNRNGSITWYNPDLPTPLADWYITEAGKIISF